MKVAIYPGSFNPWHAGHQSVLNQAVQIFDKVIVAQGINPEKDVPKSLPEELFYDPRLIIDSYSGKLVDYINSHRETIDAVIKGLRNTTDFEYEKIQQYWNEDLGVYIPTFYIISDRSMVHLSSSAIRTVEKLK
jgi:pantetheine-phosphate adenylyltransferase